MKHWTFGGKLAVALTSTTLLVGVMSVMATYALGTVVKSKGAVIDIHGERLLEAKNLDLIAEGRVAEVRGYLVTGAPSFKAGVAENLTQFEAKLREIEAAGISAEHAKEMRDANQAHAASIQVVFGKYEKDKTDASIGTYFLEEVVPAFRALREATGRYSVAVRQQRDEANEASTKQANFWASMVQLVTVVVILLSIALGYLLVSNLNHQIGAAVQHVQSAATQLQAAATQQSGACVEQAQQVTEVTTTAEELLTASRQIGERAREVAELGARAEAATASGSETVKDGETSIETVKQQVDQVVEQMLELGRKSRDIGGVLDIVNELSEQTNILAVNATIEARGAGEAGTRFSVVADEIRKLADRVATSTREIRSMIDSIRSEVNTTVMTTETGSKAVDQAAARFAEVTAAFSEISEIVVNAAEAGRTIDLSTNQQTTACEQVTQAMTEVAQASREAETSAQQTMSTAGELVSISNELMRLVRRD